MNKLDEHFNNGSLHCQLPAVLGALAKAEPVEVEEYPAEDKPRSFQQKIYPARIRKKYVVDLKNIADDTKPLEALLSYGIQKLNRKYQDAYEGLIVISGAYDGQLTLEYGTPKSVADKDWRLILTEELRLDSNDLLSAIQETLRAASKKPTGYMVGIPEEAELGEVVIEGREHWLSPVKCPYTAIFDAKKLEKYDMHTSRNNGREFAFTNVINALCSSYGIPYADLENNRHVAFVDMYEGRAVASDEEHPKIPCSASQKEFVFGDHPAVKQMLEEKLSLSLIRMPSVKSMPTKSSGAVDKLNSERKIR